MKYINAENILNEINFCDGSLRDIYVNNVSHNDWNKMLSMLANEYKVSSTLKERLPNNIEDIVNILEKQSVTMSIDVGENIIINCHFFVSAGSMDQIEFDYDPKQVRTIEKFHLISDFIRNLGNCLKKNVFITPENCSDDIMLEFDNSSNQFFYSDQNQEHYSVQKL